VGLADSQHSYNGRIGLRGRGDLLGDQLGVLPAAPARPRPTIAQYAYFSQAISDHVYRAMFESDQPADVTVEETVDALERELSALLP
jgi:hypothetical protein